MQCIKKIKRYTRGQTKQKFAENDLLQDAVIRNIEIIERNNINNVSPISDLSTHFRLYMSDEVRHIN